MIDKPPLAAWRIIMSNSVIRGMGFHHLALKASDYEKTVNFYKALGMKPVVEWGENDNRIMMIDVGDGGRLEIFAGCGDGYPAEGRWQHFALCVQDVVAAYNTALEAGAESVTPPTVMNLDDARPSRMTIQVAFVKGPDGEQIEFFKQLVNRC